MNFVSSLNSAIRSTQRAQSAVSLTVVSRNSSSQGQGTGAPQGQNTGPNSGPVIATPPFQITPSGELVVVPPENLFTEEYMKDFIGNEYQGGNSAELNDLMEQLLDSPLDNSAEVNVLLNQIADIRGVDPETFATQYQTFLVLSANGGGVGDIDLNRHPNFMGSTTHLRFGALVGDTFGIDPVFGGLLSPTGGIVGPADGFWAPGENDAIGYHGIFHDAAGYMYNHHGIGPGYDYQGKEFLPTDFPGTGQVSGLEFWLEQPGLDADLPNVNIPFTPDGFDNFMNDGFDNGVDIFHDTIIIDGGVDQVFDGAGGILNGDFGGGWNDVTEGFSDTWQGTTALGGDLVDGPVIVANGAVDLGGWGIDRATDIGGWGVDRATDVGGWGVDRASDVGGWGADRASDIGEGIEDIINIFD